jgi:hypothetical protein
MSKIEVDTVEPQSGTSLTLGASGDTITIPSGATLDASNATLTLPDGSVTTAKIVDANVTLAKLSATGTKDATTFLRGDNTFAAPSGGMTLLSTTTLASTTTSISISSTGYVELLISIENMAGATGDTKFNFNSDTGSNYKSLRMVGDAGNSSSTGSQSTTGVFMNQNGAAGYTSTSLSSFIINVYFPASTARHKSFLSNTVGEYSSDRIAMLTSGIWKDTSAITSFQLISGTGTFSGGTVYIYGVK